MPIRPPVFDPPFHIVRCSHIEYGVTDILRSKEYWVDALGYIVTSEDKDTLYLRGVEEYNHHSVVLKKSAAPDVKAIAFKVFSEEDLDKAHKWLSNEGLSVKWATKPHQGRTLLFDDPTGIPVELYFECEHVGRRLQLYGDYKGAHIQRIDHINCFTYDVQKSYDFYIRLGFRLTEYTAGDGTEDLWAVWMHRKGNVHDLAFTNGLGPRLHHIGVWVPSALNIVHICDVLATTGWLKSMERGPGRHGISNAFFLYLRDPDGHRIELFNSDYLTIDPDFKPVRWDLTNTQRQTLWGAPAPKSWFEEGSLFPGVTLKDAVFTSGTPIVAP
jgi:catechol 2,3-dioxygenase